MSGTLKGTRGSNNNQSATAPPAMKHSEETLESSYQKWIKSQLKKRVLEYSDLHHTTIFCGTWNVNARRMPPGSDLREWLLPTGKPSVRLDNTNSNRTSFTGALNEAASSAPSNRLTDEQPSPTFPPPGGFDVYAIGLQEIVELNITNVAMTTRASQESTAAWIAKIAETLSMASSSSPSASSSSPPFSPSSLQSPAVSVPALPGAYPVSASSNTVTMIAAARATVADVVNVENGNMLIGDNSKVVDASESIGTGATTGDNRNESDEDTCLGMVGDAELKQETITVIEESETQPAAAAEAAATATATGTTYHCILEKNLVGILFMIFIKDSLLPHVSNVRLTTTTTGVMGMMGNKGGIVARMNIYDSSVCFVCAHFHANRDNVVTRNQDYQSIVDNSVMLPLPSVSTSNNGVGGGGDLNALQILQQKQLLLKQQQQLASGFNGFSQGSLQNGDIASASDPSSTLGAAVPPPLPPKPSSTANTARAIAASVASLSAGSTTTTTGTAGGGSATQLKPLALQRDFAQQPSKVLDHDYVFWLGDLNYRVQENIDTSEIFERVLAGEWESLRAKDQLNLERAKKNVFSGFEEGTLNFPPTYKYQPGTDKYQSRTDKKLRAPAWCDRVLWRTGENADTVTLLDYSCSSLNMSDHKPVRASFKCGFQSIVPEKMKDLYQDLLFSVDKWRNASAPKLSVEGRFIDFGVVACDEKPSSALQLKNTGTVMTEWAFVPKNDDSVVCESWLKLHPREGILAPEECIDVLVTLDLSIDKAVQLLSSGVKALEDIVVLRVNHGNDFFCMVNAQIDQPSVHAALERRQRAQAELLKEAQEIGMQRVPPSVVPHISLPPRPFDLAALDGDDERVVIVEGTNNERGESGGEGGREGEEAGGGSRHTASSAMVHGSARSSRVQSAHVNVDDVYDAAERMKIVI